ncbi:MAG: glycosyltransferase family 39 protein [Anaerolineae bacterium]|nr:glycosyltransferase family 39 protein [Anaerolineae bacterium]
MGNLGAKSNRQKLKLDRFVWIVLVVALVLRITVMLVVFCDDNPYSGDGPFYIKNAQQPNRILGLPKPLRPTEPWWQGATTSIGPGYPVFLMPYFQLIPDSNPVAQVVASRIAQSVTGTLTALMLYLLAKKLFDERVARVALVVQALDLRDVFSSATITSETLFIFLFTVFLYLYYQAVLAEDEKIGLRLFKWSGVVLGLSLLTRPVPIAFPVLLFAHLWFTGEKRRRMLRGLGWLVGLAVLVITPWQVRTIYLTREFTPLVDSVFVHFWRTTRENGRDINSDEAMAEAAAEDTGYDGWQGDNPEVQGSEYVSAGLQNIFDQPFVWLGRVLGDTLRATVQPYGTVIGTPSGAGIKSALGDFLIGEVPLSYVLAVPALWRRLLMYIWHYWALIGGVAGIVLAIKEDWWKTSPLAAWIVYVFGVTAVLLIEPRYVFPAMFALTIFAAYASVQAWDALSRRRANPSLV